MFIFSNSAKESAANKENEQLLESIAQAKLEIESANQNFSYATEPLLVDVYTYQIKSAQAKYSYLLKKARSKGVTGKYLGKVGDII